MAKSGEGGTRLDRLLRLLEGARLALLRPRGSHLRLHSRRHARHAQQRGGGRGRDWRRTPGVVATAAAAGACVPWLLSLAWFTAAQPSCARWLTRRGPAAAAAAVQQPLGDARGCRRGGGLAGATHAALGAGGGRGCAPQHASQSGFRAALRSVRLRELLSQRAAAGLLPSEEAAAPPSDASLLTFASFDVTRVLEHGAPLLSSGGQARLGAKKPSHSLALTLAPPPTPGV